jgi:hypothetical protein
LRLVLQTKELEEIQVGIVDDYQVLVPTHQIKLIHIDNFQKNYKFLLLIALQ